jgi:hypothetical protein
MLGRLIRAGHGPERNGEPVPSVNRHDRESEVDQFLFRETLAESFVSLIGDVRLRNPRNGFRPGQGRPLAFAEKPASHATPVVYKGAAPFPLRRGRLCCACRGKKRSH